MQPPADVRLAADSRRSLRSVPVRLLVWSGLLLALSACSNGGAGDAAVSEVPKTSGDVWLVGPASDRATAPAALLAFVYGLHVAVIDGNDAYTGMTRRTVGKATGGAQTIPVSGGQSVSLLPEGDRYTLRFPGGETIGFHKREQATSSGAFESPLRVQWASFQRPAEELDEAAVALAWHRIAGVPFDAKAAAERSPTVTRASSFDRPDSLAAAQKRLEAQLAASDAERVYVVRVNDNVSDYKHEQSEFSLRLFEPGSYLPLQVFGDEYRVVFANGESARRLAMSKDSARVFDTMLAAIGRGVIDEIEFRVVGQGDPSGAVTGARIVRAALVRVRVRDRQDKVLWEPTVAPIGATAATGSSTGVMPAFSLADADVAGFHVGVKGADFEQTVSRLFGKTDRTPASGNAASAGYTSIIQANVLACMSMPGQRQRVEPGNVCVTALLDKDDIVRMIRIERLFPFVDGEVFRRALVQRYGEVAEAKQTVGYTLGWGAAMDSASVLDRSGPRTPLIASYTQDDDFMSRGLNAIPRIRVTLQLTDAAWRASRAH